MKFIASFLILFSMFLACTYERNDQGVLVKFYNETGYDITDLNIGDKQIGAFKNNESTSYLVYDTFNFDGGMPDEQCSGIIADSKVICSNIFYWCGTEKKTEDNGTYKMSIKVSEIDSVRYFNITSK